MLLLSYYIVLFLSKYRWSWGCYKLGNNEWKFVGRRVLFEVILLI